MINVFQILFHPLLTDLGCLPVFDFVFWSILKQVKSAWGAVLLDMSATFHDKKIHKRFKVERKPSGGDCRVWVRKQQRGGAHSWSLGTDTGKMYTGKISPVNFLQHWSCFYLLFIKTESAYYIKVILKTIKFTQKY